MTLYTGFTYAVQVSCEIGVYIQEWELVGDGSNAKSSSGFLSSSIKKDYGDDGVTYDGQEVGVDHSGLITGDRWIISSQRLHT